MKWDKKVKDDCGEFGRKCVVVCVYVSVTLCVYKFRQSFRLLRLKQFYFNIAKGNSKYSHANHYFLVKTSKVICDCNENIKH